MWCVVACDLENLKNEEAMTRVGSQRHRKKKNSLHTVFCFESASSCCLCATFSAHSFYFFCASALAVNEEGLSERRSAKEIGDTRSDLLNRLTALLSCRPALERPNAV